MEALSVSHQSFEVACSTISSSIHEESLWSRPKSRGSAGRVPEARSPGVACVQTTPPLKSPFSDCFLRGGGGLYSGYPGGKEWTTHALCELFWL